MIYTSKTGYHGFTRGKAYEDVGADKDGITLINDSNQLMLIKHSQMKRLFDKTKESVFTVEVERLTPTGLLTVEKKMFKRSTLSKYLGAFLMSYRNAFEDKNVKDGECKIEFYGAEERDSVTIAYSRKDAVIIPKEPDGPLLLTYKEQGLFETK